MIALDARTKAPGEEMVGEDVRLVATRQPRDEMAPYERLLGDALRGDATLFASEPGIETAWAIFDDVLGDRTPLYEYEPGTWGPREADHLIVHHGAWHEPTMVRAEP